ncbi:MAG: hypothetical protein GC162_00040 [Planctomycetes bacterium]|nr:hypothetical protein [Planctomycetota bacterium]
MKRINKSKWFKVALPAMALVGMLGMGATAAKADGRGPEMRRGGPVTVVAPARPVVARPAPVVVTQPVIVEPVRTLTVGAQIIFGTPNTAIVIGSTYGTPVYTTVPVCPPPAPVIIDRHDGRFDHDRYDHRRFDHDDHRGWDHHDRFDRHDDRCR